MRGVCRIRRHILQQGDDSGAEGFRTGNPGKNDAIPNATFQQEGGALGHGEGMKGSRVFANALLNFR